MLIRGVPSHIRSDDPDTPGVTEKYRGFDRFGRVAQQRWMSTPAPAVPVFDIRHGYDEASNRLYDDYGVYQYKDAYTYDDLHRLKGHDRVAHPIQETPLAHWSFDNTWGDATGGGHNATAHNGAAFASPGRFGSHAASFDGVDDYVSTPFVLDPAAGDFTATLWFKRLDDTWSDDSPSQSLLKQSLWRNWLDLRGEDEPKLRSYLGGSVTYGPQTEHDVWSHAAVTYAGDTLSLYLDGAAHRTTRTLSSATGGMLMGTGGDHFEGLLDDVRIYDAALSDASVAALAAETRLAWSYDQLGNWASSSRDTVSETRTHSSANEITALNGQSAPIAHDAAGNVTRVPVYDAAGAPTGGYRTLHYDAWNRVVEIETDDATPVTVAIYRYDGMGRRIRRSLVGAGDLNASYREYYQGESVVEVRNASTTPHAQGAVLKQRVWAGSLPDCVCQPRVFV
ncbi:MAG: LamG domain-containing protein [Phycisphaeraceae bacterium]